MSERQGESLPDGIRNAPGPTSIAAFLAQRLIRCASRRAPRDLAERLEEEWLADLAERRKALAQLRHALGCCWATRIIALEHHAAARTTAATTVGSRDRALALRLADADSPYSRRSVVLAVIIALHVALVLALANGLGRTVEHVLPSALQGTAIDEPLRSDHDVAPPTPPDIREQIPVLPPPDIIEAWSEEPGSTITAAPLSPVPPTPAPPPPVHRVVGGPGAGFPNTSDFYPPALIREGIQGASSVSVCIDGRGRLTSAPTIASTAGDERLDRAALRLAEAGSGHYRATTEDGQAVPSCFAFRVKFVMR